MAGWMDCRECRFGLISMLLLCSFPSCFAANEMPTLPVKLFQLLDVRKKNEINASDMQQVRRKRRAAAAKRYACWLRRRQP